MYVEGENEKAQCSYIYDKYSNKYKKSLLIIYLFRS